MDTYQNITCPVSPNRVDENTARINAIVTVIIIGFGLFQNSIILSLLLAIDFFLRAFTRGSYSPVRFLSKQVGHALHIAEKPIDASPKRFAAGMGMTLAIIISIFQLLNLESYAILVGAVLIFFALLEGLVGFCMGCLIYTYIVVPFRPKG